MLDLVLLPAALLLALGLRAERRGSFRLHGHLMLAGFTLVGLRLVLRHPYLAPRQRLVGDAVLALVGITLLLGRGALAWREGRSRHAVLPRIHRAAGTVTLLAATLATVAWLLRHRF